MPTKKKLKNFLKNCAITSQKSKKKEEAISIPPFLYSKGDLLGHLVEEINLFSPCNSKSLRKREMLLTQYLHHKSFWIPNSFDWNNRSKDGNGSRNGTSQLIGFAQFEIFTFSRFGKSGNKPHLSWCEGITTHKVHFNRTSFLHWDIIKAQVKRTTWWPLRKKTNYCRLNNSKPFSVTNEIKF